jgi:hypothetical protein
MIDAPDRLTLGPPVGLPDADVPPSRVARTILVKIYDPNPLGIVAKMRADSTYYNDGTIAQKFVDANPWQDIPPLPLPAPQTRLDLHVGGQAANRFATVAFFLNPRAGSKLSFIHDTANPSSALWAVCGGQPAAGTYFKNPRWVGTDFTMAKIHVSLDQPFEAIAYSLGINLPDANDPTYVTPTFIDPKIKNN